MTIYKSHWEDAKELPKTGVFNYIFKNNPKVVDLSKPAIIDANTGVKTTYSELISESLRFGSGLINIAKLQPGKDTILIFSPNSTLYPVLLFAGQAAGVTVSTANSSYTGDELAHQLTASEASVILVGADLKNVAREAAKQVGIKEDKIYVLPGIDGKVGNTEGLKSYEILRGDKNSFEPVEIKNLDGVAFLPFSSGTTGRAKGVQISHWNVTSCSTQVNSAAGLFDSAETVMGVLPLYHIYGLIVLLVQTLQNGGTVVLMPKFDLVQFCESVQKYKATVALLVPPIVLALAKHPIVDKYDLTSLRFFLSGAAPLSADLQSLVSKRLKGTLAFQGYGMTETTSVGLLPDIKDAVIPGACGKLLPNMEARLVDEDGKDVPIGEAGELWMRGPNIMLGYHQNEKATKETITSDGWLMTGDICVRDKNGNYFIVDRRKELIKYKGFQVPPAELEAILLTCEFVADCAVIGVWSEEQATELPRAYVVIEEKWKNDQGISKKIADFVASKAAPHKRLRGGVIVIDVIPKSPSGKILRKDLRTLAAKEKEGTAKL